MCSRYELMATPRQLAERFDLAVAPSDLACAEVRPTDRALVIAADGDRQGRALGWGLMSWDGKPLINARAETLTERKTFRALLERRCAVPATAYFEWRQDGQRRLKNRIAAADGGIVSFAGLRDDDRFVIVTCPAAPTIAAINDRMPVILGGRRGGFMARPENAVRCRRLDAAAVRRPPERARGNAASASARRPVWVNSRRQCDMKSGMVAFSRTWRVTPPRII